MVEYWRVDLQDFVVATYEHQEKLGTSGSPVVHSWHLKVNLLKLETWVAGLGKFRQQQREGILRMLKRM